MSNPVDYIRAQSASFRALAGRIAHMMHDAAIAKAAATRAGNAADVAKQSARLARLATLYQAHGATVAKLDTLNAAIARIPGAGDNYLGFIPVLSAALLAVAFAVAASMAVIAYKVHVEEGNDAFAQQIIGDPNAPLTPAQKEKLQAYTEAVGKNKQGDSVGGALASMLQPLAIGVALVIVGPKLLDVVAGRGQR